mgnify:CR=1 FL=1
MGLPEIFIAFETAAVSAVARSARGAVALVLSDDTPMGSATAVYQSLADVPADGFTEDNYRLLELAFRAAPAKVCVVRLQEEDAVFDALDKLTFNWLAAPALDSEKVVSYVKERRDAGTMIKAVVANAEAPDHEGIVNLCADNLVLSDGEIDAKDYAARIAALLAALPLTQSATYAQLPEVVSCGGYEDPDGEIDQGKLIIVQGRGGYRLGRAVNSLTTLTTTKAAPFQKIKIVEGIDLIQTDIAQTFENGYIGKVLNDYDSKLLLVTAINAYFKQLEGEVLDKTAQNLCAVSLAGQKSYLESQGTDTTDMDDAQILRANTGSQVFLEAHLTFCDAMEDLALEISM